jgi:hypothetical protein
LVSLNQTNCGGKINWQNEIIIENKAQFVFVLQRSVCLWITVCYILFVFIYWPGVEPSPLLLRPLIDLLYQPWMIDDEDCGAVGGMNDLQTEFELL